MGNNKPNWYITFIPIIFLIIFSLSIFYFSYEFNCGDDISCYNKHLESCKKTKLTIIDTGSTFEYRILGKTGDSCKVEVTLIDMPPEADTFTANLFEGKSMTCTVPKNNNFDTEILPLCTGQLKEAIYEFTIQKIYNILAQSLGDIISEI